MQHDKHPPAAGEIALVPAPLDRPVVLRELWPSLCTDDRRALRLCCVTMRDAVDAQAVCVEGQDEAPVLCPATIDRLAEVHTLSLRSMGCLRGMQPGAVFPRLRSLRLHLVGDSSLAMHAWSAVQGPCRARSRTGPAAPCSPRVAACTAAMRRAWAVRIGVFPSAMRACMHQLRVCPSPPLTDALCVHAITRAGCCCD
jgi:hypothetical protein